MSILDRDGSRGNSAIFLPRRVSRPSSSSAPRAYRDSMAPIRVYIIYKCMSRVDVYIIYSKNE